MKCGASQRNWQWSRLIVLRRSGGLLLAAFDRVTVGAPAQHASGEIGHVGKPAAPEDHRRLRRSAPGAAYRNQGAVFFQFATAGR